MPRSTRKSAPGSGSRTIVKRRQAKPPSPEKACDAPRAVGDAIEDLYARGVTDGLPVVPPTAERVKKAIAASGRQAEDLVALVPPNYGRATVEKIAVNAVLAGCRPEYLPVVIAGVEAMCDDAFDLHGVSATTNFSSPLFIVNGPLRKALDVNCGVGVFGPGWRANATIGRALRLIAVNLGGAKAGIISMSTLGHPGRYTYCIGEYVEEGHPALSLGAAQETREGPDPGEGRRGRTARARDEGFPESRNQRNPGPQVPRPREPENCRRRGNGGALLGGDPGMDIPQRLQPGDQEDQDSALRRRTRMAEDDRYLDPTDSVAVPRKFAPRPASLDGKVITLLDISKAKGDHLLDRLEELLHERAKPKAILRKRKPTFARPAPDDLRQEVLRDSDLLIEALAD
jgi:hypothetical protein